MNYLTCQEGNSDKFYEIVAIGTNVAMRYGRTGSDGVSSTKSFPSAAEAAKFVAKTVAEKVKKGYAAADAAADAGGKRAAEPSSVAPAAKKGKAEAPPPAPAAAKATKAKAIKVVPPPAPVSAAKGKKTASSSDSTPTTRYLTCQEGNSDKFYEVKQNGCDVTMRYGRTGTSGVISVKSYGSVAEATKAADKTVAEKLKKGYEEGDADEVRDHID